MSFIWAGRTDDDLQWRWRAKDEVSDDFRKRFPERIPRASRAGRLATRATVGTRWTITSGASWDFGDLLRLNDPDNDDLDVRELSSTTETVIAVAAEDITSGAVPLELRTYLGSDFPGLWNVTSVDRWMTTDVNGTTPASSHVGETFSLDNSDGWQIDLSGTGAGTVRAVDTNRSRFLVEFAGSRIQDNPAA